MTSESSSPPVVVFDLDGTLVDTTYLHALAWWRAARDAGRDVPFTVFHHLIGMGGDQLAEAALGAPDDEIEDGRAARFEELYGDVRPLPGASGLVRAVAGAGVRVVIGTSGEPADVEQALGVLDVDDVLFATVSSSEAEDTKPEPEIFELAMQRAEGSPERTVVVGDTVWDVEAAQRAGMASVALLTGGHADADLRSAGAAAVYRDPAELLDDLQGSPIGPLIRSGTRPEGHSGS